MIQTITRQTGGQVRTERVNVIYFTKGILPFLVKNCTIFNLRTSDWKRMKID